jgi:hypothetical protein
MAHIVINNRNAEGDRAFFRDTFEFDSVDVGHGAPSMKFEEYASQNGKARNGKYKTKQMSRTRP